MAFELKRDWPIVAAGAAAAGGIALVAFGRRAEAFNQPVAVGAPAEAYAAAVSAATSVELGRQQVTGQVATAFLATEAARQQAVSAERIAREQGASAERIELARFATTEMIARESASIARAQAEAQLAAVRGQQAAQQQSSLFGFLGNIAAGLIPFLFSVERTAEAALRGRGGVGGRRGRRSWNVLYQSNLTGLQTPAPGATLGIPRPHLAAA